MANITYTENPDKLTVTIDIELGAEDLAPKVKARLNQVRREATIKGFRKGKAPISFIRKVYGPGALQEEMNKLLDEQLNEALRNEDYTFFGEPEFDSEAYEIPKPDVVNIPDYKFRFESAIQPEFEVAGLDDAGAIYRYQITPEESDIDTALDRTRDQLSTNEPVDEPIQNKDMVHIQYDELDDEGNVKEDGWANTMEVLFDEEQIVESFYQQLNGQSKDFTFDFNIYEVEKNLGEEQVRKYLLKIGEADAEVEVGSQFRGKIVDVQRPKPAELNEEFFKKAFGEEAEITTEEGARERIREIITDNFKQDTQQFLQANIRNHFIEANQIPLPEEFLEKKWGESLAKEIEGKSEEEADHIRKQTLDNLRFQLIQGKLAKQYEIDYEEEELFEFAKGYARRQLQSYLPGQSMDEYFVLNMANRMLSDEKTANQILQELLLSKIYSKLEEVMNIEDKKVSVEEFNEVAKAFSEKHFPKFDAPVVEEPTPSEEAPAE